MLEPCQDTEMSSTNNHDDRIEVLSVPHTPPGAAALPLPPSMAPEDFTPRRKGHSKGHGRGHRYTHTTFYPFSALAMRCDTFL